MSSKLKAVIIGCGNIGSRYSELIKQPGIHSHAHALSVHSMYDLVGFCDPDLNQLSRATTRWGGRGFVDPFELCEKMSPDLAMICSPDPTHFNLAKSLLERVNLKAMMIEKPIAMSSIEAKALSTLSRQRKIPITVNLGRRYSSAFQSIARDVRAGKFGRPLSAHFVYAKGLRHHGSHAIDVLQMWLGKIIEAKATSWLPGLPGDPSVSGTLKTEQGCEVFLEAVGMDQEARFECTLHCESAKISFDSGGDRWEIIRDGKHSTLPPEFSDPFRGVLIHLLDDILSQIVNGTDSVSPPQNSIEALEVMEKLCSSLSEEPV